MRKKSVRKKMIGIILTYNCAGTLEDIYHRIPKSALDDIIVVDDDSSDSTGVVARKLDLKFFTHRHTGYGGNMKYALHKAITLGSEFMIEIHGDGQYDPSVIPLTIKKIPHYDLIVGSRFIDIFQPLRDKMPLIRYVTNIITSAIYRLVLGLPLTEFHNGFHVYSRKLLNKIQMRTMSNDHLFSFELLVRAHYKKLRIGEIPIRCSYVGKHSSINSLKSLTFLFQTGIVLWHYTLARLGFKTGFFKQSSPKVWE